MLKNVDPPWWLPWLFGAGVGLVTTFASDALPDNLKLIGFYFGIAFIAISACGAGAHYLPSGLLARHVPYFRRELAYLSDRDSELGSAIRQMARSSAWGKWYAAQHLVLAGVPITEEQHLGIASHLVLDNLMNGQIDARGRSPGSLGYQDIPRTDWRAVALLFLPDRMSLWRLRITARGSVVANRFTGEIESQDVEPRITHLLNFDSVIVDSHQFEAVWPERKRGEDRARRALLRTARLRVLDGPTIEWLSR